MVIKWEPNLEWSCDAANHLRRETRARATQRLARAYDIAR